MSTSKPELETLITADNRPFIKASVQAKTEIKSLANSIEKEFGVSVKQANDIATASFKKTQRAIQDTEKSLRLTLPSLRSLLIGFAGISLAVAPIIAVSRAYYEFSKQLGNLSAITGAVGKDLKFLSDASMELGTTTQFNATKVAEAFKLVGAVKGDLLGNLPALKEVTKQVILLATAADVDLATASKAVGQILNEFKLPASEAGRVVNVLAAGSANGAAEVDSLAASLRYVGPIASSLNIPLEDTVALLELLAKGGRTDTQAGTDLRQFFLRTATSARSEFNPAIVGTAKALDNLRKARLTPAEFKDFFGTTGFTGATILRDYANEFPSVVTGITATQKAQEQASIVADTYRGRIDRLSNSFEGLKIAIGDASETKGALTFLTDFNNSKTRSVKERGLLGGLFFGDAADGLNTAEDFANAGYKHHTTAAEALAQSSLVPAPDLLSITRNKELAQIKISGANSIGQGTIDPAKNFVTNMNLLATGAGNVTRAFTQVVKGVEETRLAFEKLFPKTDTGADYIRANTPDAGDGTIQAVDPYFNKTLGAIRDKIEKGIDPSNDIKTLRSIANTSGGFDLNDQGNVILTSNKAMLDAVKSLEKAQALQNTPQDVNVKIEVDNDGFIRAFATSAKGKSALVNAAQTAAKNEAAQTGF